MAGKTLNREIVLRVLSSFPALPLGTDVRVTAGPYAGMQGIVCALPPDGGTRPVVRLFLDPAGRPVAPVEVALADAPETENEISDTAERPELTGRPGRPAAEAASAPSD
ncbi:MAG: hypothetical protein EXR64_06145 [Dehalococcoidia bacterium]|nr:hypothetical protein [Dehalococcoidia bacterium]